MKEEESKHSEIRRITENHEEEKEVEKHDEREKSDKRRKTLTRENKKNNTVCEKPIRGFSAKQPVTL